MRSLSFTDPELNTAGLGPRSQQMDGSHHVDLLRRCVLQELGDRLRVRAGLRHLGGAAGRVVARQLGWLAGGLEQQAARRMAEVDRAGEEGETNDETKMRPTSRTARAHSTHARSSSRGRPPSPKKKAPYEPGAKGCRREDAIALNPAITEFTSRGRGSKQKRSTRREEWNM